jgi:hypothetical protein
MQRRAKRKILRKMAMQEMLGRALRQGGRKMKKHKSNCLGSWRYPVECDCPENGEK